MTAEILKRLEVHDLSVEDPPIEEVIDRARENIESGSREQAEQWLAFLDRYYLRGAGERGRDLSAELRAQMETRW